MNTNDGIDGLTIFTCIALIIAFISLYVFYDKNQIVKKIADFILVISPGRNEKDKLLNFIFPPLVILAFGLLFRYWDLIVK